MALVRRTVPTVLALAMLAPAIALAGSTSPSGLPFSGASAHTVQPQPPAGTCHSQGSGLYALPVLYNAVLVFYDARPDVGQRIFPTLWQEK